MKLNWHLTQPWKIGIRTGVALVLAYYISLLMDWDHGYWAGFAVVVCSLDTAGQSLYKGAQRIFGTAIAVVTSFTLLSLFLQDRWIFLAATSIYVGFCCYRFQTSANSYAWFVAAFTMPIIATPAITNPDQAFDLAILRTLETTLGVICYTIVALYLWPGKSLPLFQEKIDNLLAALSGFIGANIDHQIRGDLTIENSETAKEMSLAHRRLEAAIADYDASFPGASNDSYDVRRRKKALVRFRRQITMLISAFDGLAVARQNVSNQLLKELDLEDKVNAATQHMKIRLGIINHYLRGMLLSDLDEDEDQESIWQQQSKVRLDVDLRDALGQLSATERAALTSLQMTLERASKILGDMHHTAEYLVNVSKTLEAPSIEVRAPIATLDPTALFQAFHMSFAMAVGSFLYVMLPDLPTGTSVLSSIVTYFLIGLMTPWTSIMSLRIVVFGTIFVYGFGVYMLLMPKLTSFWEIALLIFAVGVLGKVLFAKPQQRGVMLMVLMQFTAMTGITNEQTYSFSHVALAFPQMMIVLLVVWFARSMIFDDPPRKLYLRRFNLFSRLAASLIDRRISSNEATGWRRYRYYWVRENLRKSSEWLATADKWITMTTPNSEQDAHRAELSWRIKVLILRLLQHDTAHKRLVRTVGLVPEELRQARVDWDKEAARIVKGLGKRPEHQDFGELKTLLARRTKFLTELCDEYFALSHTRPEVVEAGHLMHQMLDAAHGVNAALEEALVAAGKVNWAALKENRFEGV